MAAILPQFTLVEERWPGGAQLALLSFVFVSICVLFYATLGVVSDRILGARPRVTAVTTRLAGAAMILVGFVLFVEQAIELVPMLA